MGRSVEAHDDRLEPRAGGAGFAPRASDDPVREALLRQEAASVSDIPAFAGIMARIEANPSPIDEPRWPIGKSARLAGALALSQLRVIPHVVLPAAIMVAAVAVWAACFVSSLPGGLDPTWLFAALMLFGIALSVTLALSSDRADALMLSTPLGPQTVMFARLAAVLGIDALAGLAASAVFAFSGASADFGIIVSSWLVPLAAVAGIASLVAVWTGASWAGAVVSAALIPAFVPIASEMQSAQIVAMIASVQNALGPAGVIVIGAVLLAAVVCSARRAALARLQVQ